MARILQIGYYYGLIDARRIMLEQHGYEVVSALGNDQGISLANVGKFDVIVVGFSTSHSTRDKMVRWLKQHVPLTPVVVLLAHDSERFLDADCETLSENPEVWLQAVRQTCTRKS